jgi:hypothetical protein
MMFHTILNTWQNYWKHLKQFCYIRKGVCIMNFILAVVSLSLAFVLMVLWIRTRRAALRAEVVAYGLRAQDDSDEDTKNNLISMNKEYHVAIRKLNQLGQIKLDDLGRWVWTDSGQHIGRG